MGWLIIICFIAVLVTFAESLLGKIVLGAVALAVGLLLLRWITGVALFITLVKVCAVVIVIVVVGAILLALIN